MFFSRDAYEEFCREQYPRVFNYLNKKWKIPKEDAEDITQQIFFHHTRAMMRWHPGEHTLEEARKYLFGITKNHARKSWGRYYEIPDNVSLDDPEYIETGKYLEELIKEYIDKEGRIDIMQTLERELNLLEPIERDVVLLRFFKDENHAEICERYGWKSPGNVTRVLKKAYKQLAPALQDDFPGSRHEKSGN